MSLGSRENDSPADPDGRSESPVPWPPLPASVLGVGLAYLGFQLLRELTRIIAWLFVAGFLAIVLTPAVDLLQRQFRLRRGVATAIVFIAGLALIGGRLSAFNRSVVDQVSGFVDSLPKLVDDAQPGRGWVGHLVDRYN